MHPSTKINVDNDMCALDGPDKAELERAFNASAKSGSVDFSPHRYNSEMKIHEPTDLVEL